METIIFIVVAVLVVHYFLTDIQSQIVNVEKFNAGYHPHLDYDYAVAMRSFGRTSHINDAVNNAYCNPHGEYYTMRYNSPPEFIAKRQVKSYPYEVGYYNSCGSRTQ